jgi:hypothetical protein
MRTQTFTSLSILFIALLLVACGPDPLQNEDDWVVGQSLASIPFQDPSDFETGNYPDSNASLSIEEGRYVIRQGGERNAYIWGQADPSAQNVQVEVQAQPRSDYANDLYGVLCRVNETGAGYAFVVSSDGFGGIARTDGRSLVFLADWREHDAIQTGQNRNTIRAICVDDYLALYVNDEWVADVRDSTYPDPGQVGLLAGLLIEVNIDPQPIEVGFDDLTVTDIAFP